MTTEQVKNEVEKDIRNLEAKFDVTSYLYVSGYLAGLLHADKITIVEFLLYTQRINDLAAKSLSQRMIRNERMD